MQSPTNRAAADRIIARGAFSAVLLTALGTLAASCVGVLELDGYGRALAALCGKVAECFGPDYYPTCVESAEARLVDASADIRAGWLAAFSDNLCLEGCISARRCLDLEPVCATATEGCVQTEQCCGFTKGVGECGGGMCCSPDGVACTSSDQCCSASCEDGSCGGVVCKGGGDSCQHDAECCTEICVPLSGECAGEVCLPFGAPCNDNFECCRADGLECVPGAVVQEGDTTATGTCLPPLCGSLEFPCDMGVGCCEGLECLSVGGNPSMCLADACVPDGYICMDSVDCCGGRCVGNTCCAVPGNHGYCTIGPPLSSNSADVDNCATKVCNVLPDCCCTAWDMACVTQTGLSCGLLCSPNL